MTSLELDLKNRRRSNRLNRTVRVTAVDAQRRQRAGMALNVSCSGARLVLSETCPEEFWMELDCHTRVMARPVWKRPLERCMVVGVRFHFSRDSEREQVIRFLQRLAV